MKRLQFLLLAVLVTGLITTANGAPRRSPTHYQITPLGGLPGLTPFLPWKINNHGDIAGFAVPSDYDPAETHTLLYRRGVLRDLNLKSRLPAEYAHAYPIALNDEGTLLITTFTGVFFVVDDNGVRDFRDLGGSDELWPAAINNRGQIVGSGRAPDGSWQAFLYSDSQLQFLGGLPGVSIPRSEALSISDRGHIVGVAHGGPLGIEACIFPGGAAVSISLYVSDGILQVNRRGHITGATYQGLQKRVFLWRDGVTTLLPFPPDTHSTAFAINDHDDIVGTFWSPAEGERGVRPFLYSHGIVHDLNDLLPPASGWILGSVTDINERGEIIGDGLFNGEPQGFLLAPRHERNR